MKKTAVLMMSIFLGLQAQLLQAAQSNQIVEFRQAEVDVFSADGTERLGSIEAAGVAMPVEIVDTLSSGYYVIRLGDQMRAVRKRSVRTDRVYQMSSTCSNQFTATKTGTSRGLGNGEC